MEELDNLLSKTTPSCNTGALFGSINSTSFEDAAERVGTDSGEGEGTAGGGVDGRGMELAVVTHGFKELRKTNN